LRNRSIHVDENLLDANGNVIAEKLDPIARLGYNNYVRFTKEDIFETPKPLKALWRWRRCHSTMDKRRTNFRWQ
jgi:hypothetical protein